MLNGKRRQNLFSLNALSAASVSISSCLKSAFLVCRLFSIDPPTARDLDDALSVQPLPGGNYRVGVHIADVAHFIK